MAKHKLFLLDAMALLYRAHFAFIKNPRITSKGLHTSAVFGFTNTLMEILSKEDPTHLCVVFDTSAPTFRHVQYPEYKAHREAMPEDLRDGIPYAKKLLKALRIPMLELDGYEADDIIGTIATHAPEKDFEVYMVTPDKDYAQLVRDHVFLYKPAFKGGGFDVLGRAEVIEKFGLPPEKIIDFLGLKGDAVDNIPGIPKVGDKTAIKLLEEFDSVENIVANSDNITAKSIRESVKQFGEQGLLSKELATIMVDVPIEWSPESLQLRHMDLEAVLPLVAELEFRTTAQRLLNSKLNPMRPEQQKDLFGNATGDSPTFVPELHLGTTESAETTEQNYQLLSTQAERSAFLKRVKQAGQLCFDTETTGLDPMQAEIVGASFSIQPHEAFFVHFPESLSREAVIELLTEFQEVLASPDILKIGQNLKYDILILRNYGITVAGPMFDTMLAHYVIDPNGKHGMDAMSQELLNYLPVSIETLIGKKGKNQKSMRDVELEPLVQYAAEDADITLRLQEKLAPQVKDNFVFEKIEQALMPILADMEFEGIRVDQAALADYSEELDQRIKTLEKDIYRGAGEEFNLNSPKQLGEILFDKLGLGKGEKAKKTKTGQYQTDEQVLSYLAIKHELPAHILAYRGLQKLKSTYVDSLPKLINPKTGRVHTTFGQAQAVTGRLSSVNPNLQNIPIRTADGREVRKGFIPRDDNHLLLSADYSQVELRIMATMSKDPGMMEAFQQGQDIHRATAARVFGVSPEEVTSGQRSGAKTVNFGIIYGISAFGLSQRMGISRTEAKDIIDAYFEQYAGVKTYMDESIERARSQGYVETYFGRRRYLPDINSRNGTTRSFAERNAINSPIQGTAADLIKLAMINIHAAIDAAGLQSRMVLQVHDELIFDVHKSEVDQLKEIVRDKMLHAVEFDVPMEVEMGVGNNWLEAH